MYSIILVAAGKGKRMGTSTPKQFLEINEISLLEHTFKAFLHIDEPKEFLIVLHKDFLDKGNELKNKYANEEIKIVSGGSERFYSVQNALNALNPKSQYVMIHDGVRPFVQKEMIARGIMRCKEKGNAIPAIPLKNSIRQLNSNGTSQHIDRAAYRLIQTPQIFKSDMICSAYRQSYQTTFTDDASVVEANDESIFLYDGNSDNIKITHPEDLDRAKYFLAK